MGWASTSPAMGEGCSWKRPSSFVADTMGETGSLVGGRLSCSSARLSVADNAGNARSGEPSCNVTRCDKGPPGIVDTVGTVCPETGFPVAVLGRAWRADGCSMAAPRFRLLRKSTETKECARISGDFAAHSVFIRHGPFAPAHRLALPLKAAAPFLPRRRPPASALTGVARRQRRMVGLRLRRRR